MSAGDSSAATAADVTDCALSYGQKRSTQNVKPTFSRCKYPNQIGKMY